VRRNKKKKIIRKRKVKNKDAGDNDAEPPNYEQMEQDEVDLQINEELDAAEQTKGLPDDVEEPAPKQKKSGRKKSSRKKKSARKAADKVEPADANDAADEPPKQDPDL